MKPTVIDVRYRGGIRWDGAAGRVKDARLLVRAFQGQIDAAVGPVRGYLLKKAAHALHVLLGSAYGDEIDDLAKVLGIDPADLLVANLGYDLANSVGCSTFVQASGGAPLHARNLDWVFPGNLLRRYTTVVRVRDAPCGPYALVTWPGFFGALTAIAPGRFSVTVNYVIHATESSPAAALGRAIRGRWPVPWAVRRAMDEARSFRQAVRLLATVDLMSPVLFTVAGVAPGEAVVVERGSADHALREAQAGTVCVTNHYVTAEHQDDNARREGTDTVERLRHLQETLAGGPRLDSRGAVRLLSDATLLRDTTQQQVAMVPGTGELVVRVPGGRSVAVVLA